MKWHPNEHAARAVEPPTKSRGDFSTNKVYRIGKNGQMELFEAKTSVFRFLLPILAIGLAIFLLFTSTGKGQEPIPMQGLLCNEISQVETIMADPDHGAAMATVNAENANCGLIVYYGVKKQIVSYFDATEGPTVIWLVEVYAIGVNSTDMIALPTPLVQYGPFWPDVQPAGLQV